jgi:hypothetical protein
LPHPSRLKIAQDWLYQDHVQDHVLLAHYGLTVSGDTSIAREFEDLAKDPEKYAAEQEAHNRAKTQRPLADFAAGGDRLNPQLIKSNESKDARRIFANPLAR